MERWRCHGVCGHAAVGSAMPGIGTGGARARGNPVLVGPDDDHFADTLTILTPRPEPGAERRAQAVTFSRPVA